MKASKNRQEATVLFTDIVGYARLMNNDESKALSLLNKFKENLEHLVQIHAGQIIQYYGDAALVIFQEADAAMRCALQFQIELKKNPKVPIRIGVHMGEIIYEKGNVFGDTVNIASRLESMGIAGAVLCSERVHKTLQNKSDFEFVNIGNFKLKNIQGPINVYALSNSELNIPTTQQIYRKVARRATIFDAAIFKLAASLTLITLLSLVVFFVNKQKTNQRNSGKSLAILPFSNLSDNESNQFFCDGMMEDILNRLSRVKNLKVISRTSVQRYRDTDKSLPVIASELGVSHIVEGSIRRYGDQIRVIVNLVQAQTDRQIWSESYNRIVEDIFGIQSEIASRIGIGLEVSLLPQEHKILDYEPTRNVEAYDSFLKGRDHFHQYQESRKEEELYKAQLNFKKSIESDKQLAISWAYLGSAYRLQHTSLGGDIVYIDSAWDAINKSISINPDLPEGYLFRSEVQELKKQRQKMEADLKKALLLAPNSTIILKALGNYYGYETKEIEKSIPYYIKAISLEPFNTLPRLSLSSVYRKIGRFETAKLYLNQTITLDPNRISNFMRLADINMLEGDLSTAQKTARKILNINPDYIWGKYILAESLAFDHNFEEAETYYREIENEIQQDGYIESFATPPYRHRLGYVLWNTNRKEEAKALFDEMIERNLKIVNSDIDNLGGARYDLAAVHAFLGQKDEAIQWLDRIFEDGSWFDPYYASIDPLLASLKREERFQAILDEQNKEIAQMREKVEHMEEISFLD